MTLIPIAGNWQKFLVKGGLEIGGALAGYLLDSLSEGTTEHDAEDVYWIRCIMRWSRSTPAGTSEDLAQTSLDIMNYTSGDLDPTWTTGDFTTVDAAISTFMSALLPYQQPSHSKHSSRYYGMRFNPAEWPARRFADTGPPLYGTDFTASPGTGSAGAYQTAATITEKTALPKHWGRLYVPGLSTGALDSNGRISSTARTGILGAFTALGVTLRAADFYPVVPVTQVNKAMAFGLLSIRMVTVDDVPDVQRRRRPKQTAARSSSGVA